MRGAYFIVLLLIGCVDEAPEVEPIDAGRAVSADATPPPADQGRCEDDRFGPGGPSLPAAALQPGVYDALRVCDAPDWFTVAAPPGSRVRIRIDADRAVMAQLHADAAIASDVGRLVKLLADVPFGGLRLEVAPTAGATAYRVEVVVVEPVDDCGADLGEPDEGAPTPLGPTPVERALCDADVDWWRAEGPAGAPVDWQLDLLAGGPVQVTVLRGGVVLARGAGPGGFVHNGQPVLLRVEGPEARYRLWADTGAPANDPGPHLVEGQLEVEDRDAAVAELGPPSWVPGAGLVVDAVDPQGRLLGAAVVDSSGAFALRHAGEGGAPVTVRARAELGRWGATVGPEVDARVPWALPLAQMGAGRWRPLEAGFGGALNIARALHSGFQRLEGVGGPGLEPSAQGTPLHVVWRPRGARPCGSCFHPGPAPWIDLSGATLDPDEWDDAVILHELGHHVAARYSRDDSPGGRHDGTPVSAPLAWSEGWASFFAGWVAARPMLFDRRVDRVVTVNLEAPGPTALFDGGALDDLVSDHLVAAVLWDLWDAAEDGEAIEVEGPLFRAFFALAGPRADRGAPGTDLVDFLGALGCATPDVEAAWASTGFPLASPCEKPYGGALAPAAGARGCASGGARISRPRRGSADARCSPDPPTR